jgi:hypothetical protein
MSTTKAIGNTLLNDALAVLVLDGRVEFGEALTKALDKPDLARRCNRPLPSVLGGREPEPLDAPQAHGQAGGRPPQPGERRSTTQMSAVDIPDRPRRPQP